MSKRRWAYLVILLMNANRAVTLDLPFQLISGLDNWFSLGLANDGAQGRNALPSLTIPMGGRPEALGTAFSALADDASFLEWNPAASATLKTSELAIFHSNWIADSKIDSIVYTSRIENFGWAAGGKWLYLPFTEYGAFGERLSKGYYSEISTVLNAAYNFGNNLYFDGFAIGVNLKAGLRLVPDYTDDSGVIQVGSGSRQSAIGFMADIGCLTRFDFLKAFVSRNRNFAIAAVLRHLGPAVRDDPLPTVAVLAMAYSPIKALTLSFDLSQPVNLLAPTYSEPLFSAFGLTLSPVDSFSLQVGGLLKASGPRFSIGSGLVLPGLQLDLCYSVDLLTQFTLLNRLSLVARLDFGDGGRAQRQKQVEDLYIAGLSQYAQGDYSAALSKFDEALTISPSYQAVIKARQTILDAQQLNTQVESGLVLD